MGLSAIQSIAIAKDTFGTLWGLTEQNGLAVCDYTYSGKASDFETLLIRVSTTRATTIEAEIAPVSTIVRRRNEQLEELGMALSELSGLQAAFEDDSNKGSDTKLKVSDETAQIVNQLANGKTVISKTDNQYSATKSEVAEAVELVKTRMDKLNNDSQNDLTRLQSLVDKRDESFKTASSLMSAVSDTRSNAIKSIG